MPVAPPQALSRDALDKLDTIKMKADVERRHYEHMEEPVPDLLTEKLEQIHSLEESIKVIEFYLFILV
ncbi:hypothetical protein DPMN_088550 [Dreissena polymorpha]|uniref:Uncharacterized protein n=1 Tax=Dreissena polymorpha TaxID=45954 RepID=A0A9D4KWE5_DREPO|nr:hypothetical protein DPMN_088550 [Dreissena polymorpha]